MPELKPLQRHLGPLGKPEEGGMTRSDAARKGAAVKSMVESEGWTVMLELIASVQRHEQKNLMHGGTRPEETYERIIGQWAGLERIPAIAEGMIRLGEQANREMERGDTTAEAG